MIQASGCQHRQRRGCWRTPVTLAATTLLALMAIISAPASKADDPDDALNALMMGGTGMPMPSSEWMDSIINDYIDPATGASYTAQVVPTPANLPVDLSVHDGLADLQTAMAAQQLADPGAPYVIEGYSMSALIAVDEEEQLASTGGGRTAGARCHGGAVRFGQPPRTGASTSASTACMSPVSEVDANGAEPTDLGIPTIDVADQYDGLADVPQYPANLVADLNDLLGIIYVHTSYGDGAVPGLFPDSTPLSGPFADEYVLGSTEIVKQVTGDATFYLFPPRRCRCSIRCSISVCRNRS